MAILINDNYSLQATNKAFDARYLDINVPWANCAAAIAGIPTYRYPGLTININNEEWWWKDGITDGDLTQKSLGGTSDITGATNGLSLVNSGTTVVLGGDLTGVTIISGNSTNYLKIIGGTPNTFISTEVEGGVSNQILNTACDGNYQSTLTVSAINVGSVGAVSLCSENLSNSEYTSIGVLNNSMQLIHSSGSSLQQMNYKADGTWWLEDDICSMGIQYCSCYHNNYTNRSLVDKEYVDNTTISASNTVNVCNVNIIYTATTTNDFIGVSGATCIFLPATPKACQRITVADIEGDALTNSVEVNGNGNLINGSACATINTDYGSMTFINNNTGAGGVAWSAVAFIN